MSEISRLRMELRTEMELISIRQGDHAKVVEQISTRLENQGHEILKQAQLIQENSQETARLGREVAEGSRWMQGRMRHLQQRFDAVLGAVENEQLTGRAVLSEVQAQQQDLQVRVTRLEEERHSAA